MGVQSGLKTLDLICEHIPYWSWLFTDLRVVTLILASDVLSRDINWEEPFRLQIVSFRQCIAVRWCLVLPSLFDGFSVVFVRLATLMMPLACLHMSRVGTSSERYLSVFETDCLFTSMHRNSMMPCCSFLVWWSSGFFLRRATLLLPVECPSVDWSLILHWNQCALSHKDCWLAVAPECYVLILTALFFVWCTTLQPTDPSSHCAYSDWSPPLPSLLQSPFKEGLMSWFAGWCTRVLLRPSPWKYHGPVCRLWANEWSGLFILLSSEADKCLVWWSWLLHFVSILCLPGRDWGLTVHNSEVRTKAKTPQGVPRGDMETNRYHLYYHIIQHRRAFQLGRSFSRKDLQDSLWLHWQWHSRWWPNLDRDRILGGGRRWWWKGWWGLRQPAWQILLPPWVRWASDRCYRRYTTCILRWAKSFSRQPATCRESDHATHWPHRSRYSFYEFGYCDEVRLRYSGCDAFRRQSTNRRLSP